MKRNNSNMYQLMYTTVDGRTQPLKLQDSGVERKNFSLTELDLITSKATNLEQLIDILNESAGLNIAPKSDIYIQYKVNGKLRKTDIVYNNMTFLISLASSNKGQAKIKAKVGTYMEKFLSDIKANSDLYKFLISRDNSYRYISSWLSDAISEYLVVTDYDFGRASYEEISEVRSTLIHYFSYYKAIRGIEIGKYHYSLKLQGKEIPKDPNILTSSQLAYLNYELNRKDKVSKKEDKKEDKKDKKKEDDDQGSLFDIDEYTYKKNK